MIGTKVLIVTTQRHNSLSLSSHSYPHSDSHNHRRPRTHPPPPTTADPDVSLALLFDQGIHDQLVPETGFFLNLAINQATNQPANQPISRPINKSIDQPTNTSTRTHSHAPDLNTHTHTHIHTHLIWLMMRTAHMTSTPMPAVMNAMHRIKIQRPKASMRYWCCETLRWLLSREIIEDFVCYVPGCRGHSHGICETPANLCPKYRTKIYASRDASKRRCMEQEKGQKQVRS